MALEILFFPIVAFFIFAIIVMGVLLFAFWVWMIIDCAQRDFKDDTEKIVWILVIVLASFIGALIYYLVIKLSNPRGISKGFSRRK